MFTLCCRSWTTRVLRVVRCLVSLRWGAEEDKESETWSFLRGGSRQAGVVRLSVFLKPFLASGIECRTRWRDPVVLLH